MQDLEPTSTIAARILALMPQLCHRLTGLELVYLFGSQATDRVHPDSDIDLAVLAGAPSKAVERFDLASELAHALGREVDLVDLASTSTVMQKEVVAHGVVIFARTPSSRAAFEGRVLADYVRLNEERRPVLERIAREQTVHGR